MSCHVLPAHALSAVRAAQPLAEQYKFIVVAPECADPSDWVSWRVADAAAPATLDQEHALVRLLLLMPAVPVQSTLILAFPAMDNQSACRPHVGHLALVWNANHELL